MALSQVRPLLGPLKGEVKEKGVEMDGIDRRTRCRVGELASSPLDVAVEGRDDCVSFGFVYAPPVDDLKARLRASGVLARRQSDHRDAWRPDRGEA